MGGRSAGCRRRDERVVDAATIDALRVLAVSPRISAPSTRCATGRIGLRCRSGRGWPGSWICSASRWRPLRSAGSGCGRVRRLLGRNSGASALLAALERKARARDIGASGRDSTVGRGGGGFGGVHVAELLAADEVVLAKRDAALDVLLSAGMQAAGLGELQSQDAHLREAIFWRTYSLGPVLELHRACAADVSRELYACGPAAGRRREPAARIDAVARATGFGSCDRPGPEWNDRASPTFCGADFQGGDSSRLPPGCPTAVVFVVSATGPLVESDCHLLDSVAASTDLVIGVVSKIDVHRRWRDVLERTATVSSRISDAARDCVGSVLRQHRISAPRTWRR